MTHFIDTIISASLIAGVMLIGVLASAVYETIQERKSNRKDAQDVNKR